MKIIEFDKMQATGNTYIYVDAREEMLENPGALAAKISHYNFGVGSDGLVLIKNSAIADFRMRMFNSDGSESAMCGNASRCIGKYVYEKKLTNKTNISLETGSGIKTLQLEIKGDRVRSITVDMDAPRLRASEIPVHYTDTLNVPLVGLNFTCVSMGNPHAVTFVDDVADFPVETTGKKIENHPLFPERTNVEFAQIISPQRIKMRVWERGTGETFSCGTGACATLVAAVLRGKTERKATIELLGGEVTVEWNEKTNRVALTGGAEWIFNGTYKY